MYKDAQVTCDVENPRPDSYLDFPETVQAAAEPTPVPMDLYTGIWQKARYGDLFSEAMRTDGAYTEQIAAILMDRFTAEPSVFIRPASQTGRR